VAPAQASSFGASDIFLVIYYLVPIVSRAETALFHICDYVALDNGRAPVKIYNIMNTLYGFVLIKCYNIKEKIKIIINIIFILHKRIRILLMININIH